MRATSPEKRRRRGMIPGTAVHTARTARRKRRKKRKR
jgi:hypothetical protein